MPEIRFTNQKADRWLERLSKRSDRLSPEDTAVYIRIKQLRAQGEKLPDDLERALYHIGKKV